VSLLLLLAPAKVPVAYSQFTGTNGAAWGSEWTVGAQSASSTQTIDTNRGKQITGAAGGYTDWMASYLNFGTVQNGTVIGTFATTNVATEHYGDVMFRSTDNLTSGNGYALDFTPASSVFEIGKYVSGSYSAIAGATVSFTYANNTVYNWKIDFSGSTLRAKIWTGAEPTAWNITITDTTYTAAGRVGLAVYGGAAATAHTCYWDDIVVWDSILSQPVTDLAGLVDSAAFAAGSVDIDVAYPTDQTVLARGSVALDLTGPTDPVAFLVAPAPLEPVGTTDSVVIARGLVALDPVTLTDPVDLGGAVYTDLANPTDVAALGISPVALDLAYPTDPTVLARGSVVLDLTGPTDSALVVHGLAPVEPAGLVDLTIVEHGLVPVDSAGLTDSAAEDTSTGPFNFTVTPVEPAGLVDSATFAISTVVTDLAVLTDGQALNRTAVATDLAYPTDPTVVLAQHFQIPMDAGYPTDSITWGWGSSPVENAGLVDSATFVLGRGVVTTEDAGTTDSWRADRAYSYTDLTGSTDVPSLGPTFAIVDSSAATDFATGQGSTFFVQTPTDSAGVTDAPSLALALSPTSENAGLTDPTTVTPGRQVAGQDIAWPTDPVSLGFTDVQEDSAGITDPVRLTFGLGPVESVTMVEQQVWDRAHFFSDPAVSTDPTVVSQGFGVLVTDVASTGGSDPAVIGKTWAVASTDDAGVGEYYPWLAHGLGPIDSAGLSDPWIGAPGREEPAGVTDLVTLALGEVDLDNAGVGDPVTVAMGGGLYTQDQGGVSDSISLARGLGVADTGSPTDLAATLRFNDQQATDGAGSVDTTTWGRWSVVEDFPIVQDSIARSYATVTSDAGGTGDFATYDRASATAERTGTTDPVSIGQQPARADSAGLQDQAVIVVTVAYADTNLVRVTDPVIVSAGYKITVLDSSGVRDFGGVANGILRLVTVEGSLAPQERVLAHLADPGRLAGLLGLPVPIVAQMAAQGRISVVLAEPPRIVAILEAQP
jgi:hypothetical protein